MILRGVVWLGWACICFCMVFVSVDRPGIGWLVCGEEEQERVQNAASLLIHYYHHISQHQTSEHRVGTSPGYPTALLSMPPHPCPCLSFSHLTPASAVCYSLALPYASHLTPRPPTTFASFAYATAQLYRATIVRAAPKPRPALWDSHALTSTSVHLPPSSSHMFSLHPTQCALRSDLASERVHASNAATFAMSAFMPPALLPSPSRRRSHHRATARKS